jgi:hypothetical protein
MISVDLAYTRGGGSFTWRIIAPPSAAQPTGVAGEFQLAIPDLPGDEAFEPRSTDTVGAAQHVRNYAFTATTGVPVTYASVSVIADLAIDTESGILGEPFDTFLTAGLGPVDLSRMVVSIHKP